MGEYDDVQGFGFGEPDEIPEPNFESEIKDSFTETEPTAENVSVSENSDTTDTETEKNETPIENEDETAESTTASIYEDLETKDEDSDFEEEDNDDISVEKQINEAEPIEKMDVPPNKPNRSNTSKRNDAKILNRKRFFKIAGISAAAFCIIFIVLPFFTPDDNKKNNEELDKASSTYIPPDVQHMTSEYESEQSVEVETAEEKQIVIDIPQSDVDQNLEEMFPPPGEAVTTAVSTQPVTETKTVIKTAYIETARNEQQKDLVRKSLPNLTPSGSGSGSTNSTSQGNYTGNQGYNQQTPGSVQSLQQISELLNSQGNKTNSSGSEYSYSLQNNQSDKQDFFDSTNSTAGNYTLNSKYAIYKGTIITAVLDTAINTDLPGNVTAHVTKNVYNSLDGQYLIIPQGSILFGTYNSTVTYGQTRVQVVWNTIIRPDGLEIDIGKMNGTDKYGYSGYEGEVSNHPFEYLKAFGLISAYSVVDTKMDILQDQQQNRYAQNVLSDVYAETQRLNNEVLRRALDIQPTITIPEKSVINVITNVTMTLPPLDVYEVTEKYVR